MPQLMRVKLDNTWPDDWNLDRLQGDVIEWFK